MKKIICVLSLTINASAFPNTPITLYSSGDLSGTIDKENIERELATDSSATRIKLAEGVFYINEGIGIENFNGVISGHNKNTTKLVAVGAGISSNRNSVLFMNQSNVTLKNFEIEVPEGTSYLDSSPTLEVSDGGAAIDIVGGNVKIRNITITTPKPFSDLTAGNLETGILVQSCDEDVVIKKCEFVGVKRSVVFAPINPTECNLRILENHFTDTRGGVFMVGFGPGVGSDGVIVKGNKFKNTLVGEIFYGFGVDYPARIVSNTFHNEQPPSNAALFAVGASGELTIKKNTIQIAPRR